jgi:hypothetical protein
MPIQTAAAQDGTLTYLIDQSPADLPTVRGRDLLLAWELARDAAHRAAWGNARAFRFRRADGSCTDLALHDRDARCWAGAVDRAVGIESSYGLSVCLRLLALVDLLARAPWAAELIDLGGGSADLHPALLRLAAETRLTEDARFDEPGFRLCLQSLPVRPAPRPGAHLA